MDKKADGNHTHWKGQEDSWNNIPWRGQEDSRNNTMHWKGQEDRRGSEDQKEIYYTGKDRKALKDKIQPWKTDVRQLLPSQERASGLGKVILDHTGHTSSLRRARQTSTAAKERYKYGHHSLDKGRRYRSELRALILS